MGCFHEIHRRPRGHHASSVPDTTQPPSIPNLGTAKISRYACRDIFRATPAPSTKPRKCLGTVYLGFSSLRFRFSMPVSGLPPDTQGGLSRDTTATIRNDAGNRSRAKGPGATLNRKRKPRRPARPTDATWHIEERFFVPKAGTQNDNDGPGTARHAAGCLAAFRAAATWVTRAPWCFATSRSSAVGGVAFCPEIDDAP